MLIHTLQAVLNAALADHEYVTDIEQYHTSEHWEEGLKGDCEDFALWVRAELKKRGIDSKLLIARTEKGTLHMTTYVDGWVIDNRHKRVKSFSALPYKWLQAGLPDGTWKEIIT